MDSLPHKLEEYQLIQYFAHRGSCLLCYEDCCSWIRLDYCSYLNVLEGPEPVTVALLYCRCFHLQDTSRNLKMETICSSETFVNFYQPACRHIPEDSNLCSHGHERLKPYTG